jgi:3-oxoacyl-[acyl-carrier protein] reductase
VDENLVYSALLIVTRNYILRQQSNKGGNQVMSIPTLSLTGRKAIVTGARRGVGKQLSTALAEAGADVSVWDVIVEDGALEDVAKEIRELGCKSVPVQVDISQRSSVDNGVRKVLEAFGRIDILVNNAGVITEHTLMEIPDEDWTRLTNVDLTGYHLCSQAVSRLMVDQRSGNIINILSVRGLRPRANHPYCVHKAGQVMLTKLLAIELGPYGIRVNGIAPYVMKTEMTNHWFSNPEVLKARQAQVPLGGRIAETNDLIGPALFLASDASGFVTGQVIVVDGGAELGEFRSL